MKLLFIRHGDPDYTIDSLTEKGWKEAEFLSEKIAALDVRDQKTGCARRKDHSLGLASPGLDEDRKFLQL